MKFSKYIGLSSKNSYNTETGKLNEYYNRDITIPIKLLIAHSIPSSLILRQ